MDDMKNAGLYIHGKGGSAAECKHYKPLFPDCEVFGLDYRTFTPWETGAEIHAAVEKLKTEYEKIILIANSIGAFFSMNAGIDNLIRKAYFISPVVDMERLIGDMMLWANVTEEELKSKGAIHTEFGEDLSWDYLCYVREHPIQWRVPTNILYGSKDKLTSLETICAFAEQHDAVLTVMQGGEHWFHTDEQMRFLDDWIRNADDENGGKITMMFKGIGRTFSTENDQQYETIGAFWDELAAKYGRANLQGLGYGWTNRSIEYVIGLIDGEIDGADRTVELPDTGWVTVRGKTADLGKIYEKIYQEGRLSNEIERFTDSGDCEIMYRRLTILDK